MATAASISRAVVSAAADFVANVERAMAGDGKIRTAQGNAWDAIQADRARAQARADMDRLVRSLLAPGPAAAPAAGRTQSRLMSAGAAR